MPALPLDEVIEVQEAQKVRSQGILTDFDMKVSSREFGEYSRFPWLVAQGRIPERSLRLSTSSARLDNLLGGGIGSGYVTDFYGPRSSGKSQLCFQIAVNNSALQRRTLLIDTLGSFRPERIKQIAQSRGLDPQNVLDMIFVLRCLAVDQQLEVTGKVREFLQKDRADLVIIDDIASNFVAAKEDATNIELRSAFAEHLHDISHLAVEESLMIVVTNSVRTKLDMQEPRSIRETLSQVIARSVLERIKVENRGRFIVATNAEGRTASYAITEKGIEDW